MILPANVAFCELSSLKASVGDAAPSAVVLNINLPGTSSEPGVPSISALISAEVLAKSTPSAPNQLIDPKLSPF